ncbi:MAG: cytochrome c3 family protein [Acidobacteriota bacterium]|nr:cytochrome c3 family protein [Acidobacteriota bacterium]
MKRIMLPLALISLVLVAGVTWVGAQSSVVDTKHNLSSTAGADQITDKSTNEDQICVFCHTPHQASPAAPLWNHTQSSTASYGVYTSSTLDASDVTDIGGGTDVSNLCMSCHDGTVGVNDLGNPANDTGANPTMGSGTELDASGRIQSGRPTNMGTSLSDDHPVNFTYDAALATADGELATPDSTSYVDAAHTVPLFGGKVQCASCHDPHDNTNEPFLTKSNAGSQLCSTCHVK